MAKRKSSRASPIAMDRKYMAQEDLRTLQRAVEIEKDRSRLAAANREAQQQMAALAEVKKKAK